MESIIETLYINLDRPQVQEDPNLEQIKAEYDEMRELIAKQYGPDFMDRFTNLRDRLNERDWEREFSLGFRTCTRLLQEALRPG